MKTYLDTTCPRCGWTCSTRDISHELALELTKSHVCVDGERTQSGAPVVRHVPGPGERGVERMSLENLYERLRSANRRIDRYLRMGNEALQQIAMDEKQVIQAELQRRRMLE